MYYSNDIYREKSENVHNILPSEGDALYAKRFCLSSARAAATKSNTIHKT